MRAPTSTKVYFRILNGKNLHTHWNYVKIHANLKTIYTRSIQDLNRNENPPKYWEFHTDGLFVNQYQSEIYETIIRNVLDNFLHGENGVVLAFGQTGSGKSATINGLDFSYEDRGILPRAINDIFALKNALPKQLHTCLFVSYIEISKNTVYDLLKPWPGDKDISRTKVRKEHDALRLLFLGEGRKNLAENQFYYSHANSSIYTFHFYAKDLSFEKPKLIESKLHFVDLAGADTIGNLSCFFKDARQVGSANLAKSQLEQFFLTLARNVPYKTRLQQNLNSMLSYLDGSLNPATILRFIGHIRITRDDLTMTLSMLRFGQLIKHSMPKSNRCDEIQVEKNVDKVEPSLELQFEMQKLHLGFNEERMKHVERTVSEFLANKISKTTLLNVVEPEMALEVMKALCQKNDTDSVNVKPMIGSKSSSANLIKRKLSDKRSTGKSQMSIASDKRSVQSQKIKKSGSSLLRKGSISSKRKSTSNASLPNEKSIKSRSMLLPDMVPEYEEAWSAYLVEKEEDYHNIVGLFKINEAILRKVYKIYVNEMENLKRTESDLESAKHDLILAKFTQELCKNRNENDHLKTMEMCTAKKFESLLINQKNQQETLLELQTELKLHIGHAKDIKSDLKAQFDAYCKEKFNILVENLTSSNEGLIAPVDELLDVQKCLLADEPQPGASEEQLVKSQESRFEEYKLLTNFTRKQTLVAKEMKKNEWISVF